MCSVKSILTARKEFTHQGGRGCWWEGGSDPGCSVGRPWADLGCKEAGSTGCEDEPLSNPLRLEVGEMGATAGGLTAETASSQPVTCWGRGGGGPALGVVSTQPRTELSAGWGGSMGSLSTAPVRAAGRAGARLQQHRNLLPRFSRADRGTRG